MTGSGLREVANPSELFCRSAILVSRARPSSRASRARGHCWSRSGRLSHRARSARHGAPSSAGIRSRLSMVLAVLEAHCGVRLGGHDVHLNVAGGHAYSRAGRRPAAAAAALVSSLANAPLPADAGSFGKYRCPGGSAPVAQSAAGLKEAAKLGFNRAIGSPEAARSEMAEPSIKVTDVNSLAGLVADIAARGKAPRLVKLLDKTGDGAWRPAYTAHQNRLRRPHGAPCRQRRNGLKIEHLRSTLPPCPRPWLARIRRRWPHAGALTANA